MYKLQKEISSESEIPVFIADGTSHPEYINRCLLDSGSDFSVFMGNEELLLYLYPQAYKESNTVAIISGVIKSIDFTTDIWCIPGFIIKDSNNPKVYIWFEKFHVALTNNRAKKFLVLIGANALMKINYNVVNIDKQGNKLAKRFIEMNYAKQVHTTALRAKVTKIYKYDSNGRSEVLAPLKNIEGKTIMELYSFYIDSDLDENNSDEQAHNNILMKNDLQASLINSEKIAEQLGYKK